MVIFLKNKYIDKADLSNIITDIYSNSNNFEYTYISNSTNDTITLALEFAKKLKKGDIININGELGAGKTVFVTGVADYFIISDQVSSPTFTIVNEYITENNAKIFHFDVYRITDSDDFIDSIGTEYFENGICIIEWGNIIQDILPKSTVNIDISKDENNDNIRIFKIWRN